MLRGIDHVALAVSDLDAAIDHYQRVWGLTLAHREVVPEQGVEEAMFRLGDTYLQLVAPLSPESPVGRFIQRRGEGLHHIAYRVDEIEEALASARENRMRLVDDRPRRGSRNTRIAFVHPATNHGVLVELVQTPGPPSGPPEGAGQTDLPAPAADLPLS